MLLACLVAMPAMADEVRLVNGDRITGEIKSRSGGHLVVKTGYAGEITVRLSEVQSLAIEDEGGRVYEVGAHALATFDPRPYKRPGEVAYSAHALVSAAYTRGNTSGDHLHAEAELAARALEYRYNISGRVDRRSEPLAGPSAAWLAGANYDRFLALRRFVYVRGSLEHDRAKDIDRRATAGAGYGFQVLENQAADLAVRAGLDYVAVDRISGAGEEYPALGWGVKARYAPWGRRLELFHEHQGFWNLDDTDAVVVRSKTGARVPLVERFNATAQFNVDWERRPAPGRASTDSILLLGLDYSF